MSLPSADELESLAALHALDLLGEPERCAFESQVEGDDEAKHLASRYHRTAANLLQAIPAREPPFVLRDRLLERLSFGDGESSCKGELPLAPGILLVHSQKKPWEETGIAGIRKKTLHYDPERNYASNLVSMDAGSIYPSHWHADFEELFMLSGQIRLSGHTLGMGDYCRADPDTVHEEVVAASDCLFIALASLKNELRQSATAGSHIS